MKFKDSETLEMGGEERGRGPKKVAIQVEDFAPGLIHFLHIAFGKDRPA